MILAQFALYSFEHFLSKLFAAQTPTSAEDLERLLVRFLKSPQFHPPLKLLPTRCCVPLNAVLSQQSIDPNPIRPMLGGSQVPAEAAPRISQKALLSLQQLC